MAGGRDGGMEGWRDGGRNVCSEGGEVIIFPNLCSSVLFITIHAIVLLISRVSSMCCSVLGFYVHVLLSSRNSRSLLVYTHDLVSG